ncbi:MAG TPA: hypothetical protein VLV89_00240 [Candidatus Acidoferrum sp.]|nr:hypothetical protein [Candidatus Acidoferrum sp.]
MYVCPHCDSEINTATEVCPHCGADLAAEAEPTPPKPLGSILLRWGILLGVLFACLWGFLLFVMPAHRGDPALQAETHAVAALNDLHAALESYAAAQPGKSFPASLEPLGDRARAAAQLAQSEGYQLSYTPSPAGEDGAIHSYALQAHAGNFGYRNFYMDESGTLRATKENRAATSQDPPV